MKADVGAFLEEIPQNIRINSREYIGEHLGVFEPKKYVTGQKMSCDHYHFILFFSHPPLLKIGETEYQFQKGSLVSLEPGMDITVLPFNSTLTEKYISISINKRFFKRIAMEATDKKESGFRKMESVYSHRLLGLIDNFKQELLDYGEGYPMMVHSIATQLTFQLLRDWNAVTAVYPEKRYIDIKYVNKALEYMQGNYNSVITLEDVSREVYASPVHFERVFKSSTGLTPHQYLIKIRLQKAKEILKGEDCSIEEVAKRCGFVNTGHFSTTFKRIVGMSPSEFIRKLY